MLQEKIELINKILFYDENREKLSYITRGCELTAEEEKLRIYKRMLENDMKLLECTNNEMIKHDAIVKATLILKQLDALGWKFPELE